VSDGYRIVFTTTGSDAEARTIARALVERRLAACVHIVPGVCSVFRWEGRVCEESERQVWIKTTASRVDAVSAAIGELHSYDVPELVVVAIEGGSDDYLAWLAEAVAP
jgi:periplasmic divalent cation tolerance protein